MRTLCTRCCFAAILFLACAAALLAGEPKPDNAPMQVNTAAGQPATVSPKPAAGSVLAAIEVAAGEKLRIACVGDSISKNRHALGGKGWPNYLGRMLGPDYDVQTFSDNGVDCLRVPSQSVWVRSNIKKAVAFKPHVVIIMLGTNVSKPGLDVHLGRYAGDYRALIAFMKQSPSKPKVVLCTPIPVWEDNFGIRGDVVRNRVTPIIEKIAQDDGYPLIDTYTPLKDKKQYTTDGVHPEAAGLEALARVMYQGLLGKPAPAQSFLEEAKPAESPATGAKSDPATVEPMKRLK